MGLTKCSRVWLYWTEGSVKSQFTCQFAKEYGVLWWEKYQESFCDVGSKELIDKSGNPVRCGIDRCMCIACLSSLLHAASARFVYLHPLFLILYQLLRGTFFSACLLSDNKQNGFRWYIFLIMLARRVRLTMSCIILMDSLNFGCNGFTSFNGSPRSNDYRCVIPPTAADGTSDPWR